MSGNEERCPVSGKRQYATEGEALATADHQTSIARASLKLYAYRCKWCGAWHLTKTQSRSDKDRL